MGVRSDVHKDLKEDVAVSTFEILLENRVKSDANLEDNGHHHIDLDEDGDLILNRSHECREFITICHACSTHLTGVGLQVWPGALLLADYILAQEDHFSGCVGLDVGAGTGFAGLVLARTARRVYLADHDAAVLRNCLRNVEANKHLFRQGPDVALVRHMDLFHAVPSEPGRCADANNSGEKAYEGEEGAFQWLPEDTAELTNLHVILAADMIYDDDLTEAFIRCVVAFLEGDPGNAAGWRRTVLLATEKRYNFGKYDVTSRAHAYEFLMSLFDAYETVKGGLQARRVAIEQIPQRFEYSRSEHLELWELTVSCTVP